jgi:rhodanese-related sulfurtransferase
MWQFLENNVLTVSITFISGYMLFWSFYGNRLRGIQEVDSQGAMTLINRQNALVLDVREQGEYDAGHIINSRLIPTGQLKERIGELEKYREHHIVVVCRSGGRATGATAFLNKQGFAKAQLLVGGVMAWQKSNLPLQR